MNKYTEHANYILTSLKNGDSLLLGLYDLLNICQHFQTNDFIENQHFLIECINILKNSRIKAGNTQLDNFVQLFKTNNNISSLLNSNSPAQNFITMLLQTLGYTTENTSSSTPRETPNSANSTNNVVQRLNAMIPDAALISSRSQPAIIQTNMTGSINNTPAQSMSHLNSYISDMAMINQQANQLNSRLSNEAIIMNNDPDPNNVNIQLMQQNVQQPLINNAGGMPFQFMNIGGVQPRHAQMMPTVIANQDDPNFANFAARFSNPMNIMNTRQSAGNYVFVANQPARPGGAFLTPNPQMLASNLPNAFIVNNPGILQSQLSQIRMNRPMNQPNLMQFGNIRAGPMNISGQLIRQPSLYMIPQQGQQMQPQLIQQIVGTPGLSALDPQGELINIMSPVNGSGTWSQNQNIALAQSGVLPKVLRDNIGQTQVSMPMINIGAVGPTYIQGGAIRPPQTIPITSQTGFERSSSQPATIPLIQSQTISRPISDSAKPSIVHYRPANSQDNQSFSINPDIKESSSRDEIELKTCGESADIDDDNRVAPLILSQCVSPTKSGASNLSQPNSNTVDIFVAPTTIRLCNSIPTCDSSPAMNIIEEAIKNIKSDHQIVSSIPNSTFIEIIARRKRETFNFKSQQKFIMRESIFESVYSRDHIEIQMKCLDNTNSVNKWPSNFALKLNGHQTTNVARDNQIGDECMFIKNKLKKQDNLLEIECVIAGDSLLPESAPEEQYPVAHKFLINLALRSTLSVMLRALVNKRTQSVIKSIEFIQNFFVVNPIEMARGYTIISFLDPVTKNRIMIPVRGENCKHVQCLDFESLCMRYVNRTHFKCPVCGVVGSIPGVIIDGFMCTLVSRLKEAPDVSKIRITPECNWSILPINNMPPVTQAGNSENRGGQSDTPEITTTENKFSNGNYKLTNDDLMHIFGGESSAEFINILSKTELNVTIPQNDSEQPPASLSSPLTPKMQASPIHEVQELSSKKRTQNETPKKPPSSKDPDIYFSDAYATTPKKQAPFSDNTSTFDSLFLKDTDNIEMITPTPQHKVGLTNKDQSSDKPLNSFGFVGSNDIPSSIFNFSAEDLLIDADPNLSLNIANDKDSIHISTSYKSTWETLDDDFLKDINNQPL